MTIHCRSYGSLTEIFQISSLLFHFSWGFSILPLQKSQLKDVDFPLTLIILRFNYVLHQYICKVNIGFFTMKTPSSLLHLNLGKREFNIS